MAPGRTPCALGVLYLEGALRAPLTRDLPHKVQTLLRYGSRTIVLDFTDGKQVVAIATADWPFAAIDEAARKAWKEATTRSRETVTL